MNAISLLLFLILMLIVISKSQVYHQNITNINNFNNNIVNKYFFENEYNIFPIILCLYFIDII